MTATPPYIIAYSKCRQDTFLGNALFMEDLHSMRTGKDSYGELLKGMPCLEGGSWLFAGKACPDGEAQFFREAEALLRAQGCNPPPDAKVIICNMELYPIDFAWLEHLLTKALQTNLTTLVYAAGTKRPALACVTCAQLDRALQSPERASIEAGPDRLADLSETDVALRLFSSNFSLRHFNTLSFSRNVFFLKQSGKVDKMRAEYTFFSNVPPVLRPYFPHVGDFLQSDKLAGYEIELVPSLDVAKSLLNGVFAQKTPRRALIKSLTEFLDACPAKKVGQQAYRAAAHSCFVRKGEKRLRDAAALPCAGQLDRTCRMNGFASFQAFGEGYLALLEKDIAASAEDRLVFSHGDLFFSNILFDPVTGRIKLIDPRGMPDTDELSSYLPAWYDLAKLSHSFLGHYDLMLYDMIDVRMREDCALGLAAAPLAGLDSLGETFMDVLRERGISLKRLRLYEGSLFLSMLPLHSDDPLRMQRQLVRAMELYHFSVNA